MKLTHLQKIRAYLDEGLPLEVIQRRLAKHVLAEEVAKTVAWLKAPPVKEEPVAPKRKGRSPEA